MSKSVSNGSDSRNNIASLTSPLKTQYLVFNPMDNKLAHLLVTESQYLQFIRILSTSRKNANKLSLQSSLPDSPIYHNEYHDLLKSFSSDTTGDTQTEVLTELEEDNDDDNDVNEINNNNKNCNKSKKDLLNHDKALNDMVHLIDSIDLNGLSSDDDVNEGPGGVTFEDLEIYEQLLNDFESTRDEDLSKTLNTNAENPVDMDTRELLNGLSDDVEDDSTIDVNNSFTNYIKKKFKDEESSDFLNNPQEFLRKVSRIWQLIPKNLIKNEKPSDINKDQFHEFFMKWKEQHKPAPSQDLLGENSINGPKKLRTRIQRDPDVEISADEITDELIADKISVLSKRDPSSPFEFFYNDQLKTLLGDARNFNMKKKVINAKIMTLWEKVSVLEKARYSSIVIDEHKRDAQFVSPSRRSVSYSSVPSSKLSSPQRSVSTFASLKPLSPVRAEARATASALPAPKLASFKSDSHAILTPPVSPPDSDPYLSRQNSPRKGMVNEEVKKLNKKKSWGRDDKWL